MTMENTDASDASNDHSSSNGSKPTTDDSSSPSSDRTPALKPKLASRETMAVTYGKVFMVILLLVIAAAAAAIVYRRTRAEQESELVGRFTNLANQVIAVYEVNAETVVAIFGNFAIQVASYAMAANVTWPFVTIPAFEASASRLLEQTGAASLAIAPIVLPEQREEWENFTVTHSRSWMEESLAFLQVADDTELPYVPPAIYVDVETFDPIENPVEGNEFFNPLWQYSPLSQSSLTNFEPLSLESYEETFEYMTEVNVPVLSEAEVFDDEPSDDPSTWPQSILVVPVYSTISPTSNSSILVASLVSSIPWHNYFVNLLPGGPFNQLVVVITDSRDHSFTLSVNGPTVSYMGLGANHDPRYEQYVVQTTFKPRNSEMEDPFTISLYPTSDFVDLILTDTPIHYTVSVLAIFVFTIGVFLMYDCFVERRQMKVMTTAERSTAIVSSLFPQEVANRLMEDAVPDSNTKDGQKNSGGERAHKISFADSSGFHRHKQHQNLSEDHKHIAELFPAATVAFADIVGFTAWSSEREPCQVFELLEQIYSSFDQIAKRRKVFKVETIGDCYMAAAGLPEKRDDHAIVMARFSRDCLRKMLQVVRKLESQLGPSTGDLGMRIGIHSGPVTAGVLRGDKARFQLFGDTVNTAARMESTGIKNKIQVSAETAALIQEADQRELWVLPREDQIEAKGKGMLNTFWLAYSNMGGGRSAMTASSGVTNSESISLTTGSDECDIATEMLEDTHREKLSRSVDWAVDVLQALLKRIVAIRGGVINLPSESNNGPSSPANFVHVSETTPLEEVVEVINLHSQTRSYPVEPSSVTIPPVVVMQLRKYVTELADTYHNNFFHNFEHATHVTMSVAKLLTRVVTPNEDCHDIERVMHEYTFGITSDPLAQFAVAFSALIHDADHPGVPNATLVKEGTDCAIRYKNQSVAEQNSVDLAWKMLADPMYADLRACIYNTQEEFQRFRQLVVNTVMATDIVDRQLGAARRARWQKAFAAPGEQTPTSDEDSEMDANRKATIVIEHLIQASDVAHTMQHWHIYIRWNERFFCECYQAYLDGRSEKDPSIDWYKSELSFFDFYIIPLAKKLKECQVFGVASDEYLNYASVNRQEWELKGQDAVKSYIHNFRKKLAKRERQVEAGL